MSAHDPVGNPVDHPPTTTAPAPLALGTTSARWVLLATVLASAMAFIDGTIVMIALPIIQMDFHADFPAMQWVVNAYTLTLGALILVAGALGDRVGRRRVFVIGIAIFALASLACAFAPDVGILIGARAVQGIGERRPVH